MAGKTVNRYILFEYVTAWEQDHGHPLAVLTLGAGDQGFRLYTAANWRERVPREAIPLIEETFADWKTLGLREAVDLFPHLAQLGAGPLQAGMSGNCTYLELRAILKKELGIEAG